MLVVICSDLGAYVETAPTPCDGAPHSALHTLRGFSDRPTFTLWWFKLDANANQARLAVVDSRNVTVIPRKNAARAIIGPYFVRYFFKTVYVIPPFRRQFGRRLKIKI